MVTGNDLIQKYFQHIKTFKSLVNVRPPKKLMISVYLGLCKFKF